MSADIAEILVLVLTDFYRLRGEVERLENTLSSREAELQRAGIRIDELVEQRDTRAIPPTERKA